MTEGLLAALGIVAATWPLTTLLVGSHWLWQVVALVLAMTAVGAAARAAGVPRSVVPAAQVVVLAAVVATVHLTATTSVHLLATQISGLVQDAHHTITTSAPPAPVTPGLSFVLALVVPLLAVAADYLAATRRSPAAAGIPLLGVFMLSASNQAAGLNPLYFAAIAIVWLVMLAHGMSATMHGWASTFARAATPTRLDGMFSRQAAIARTLGIATVALALIVPAALPHRAPVMLGGGLSHSGSGGVTGGGSMFGSEEDIARDLRDQGTGTVLSFRTDDPAPPPLQVMATSAYQDGQWNLRPPHGALPFAHSGDRLTVPGLSAKTSTHTFRMRVADNTLQAPQLAAPYPVTSANLGDTPWQFRQSTGRILPKHTTSTYAVTYRQLGDNVRPSAETNGPTPDRENVQLPRASADTVRALADKIGGRTPFGQAIAIQDYLRGGDFTYSLKLAHRRTGHNGKPLDPLSNFLATKIGYCTQFATAMVMLARADGIPARFAVGFLPGEQQADGSYQVVRSDAHAWPELWFPGLGWTRFEPTPGQRSGAAPLYAIATEPDTSGAPTQQRQAPSRVPERTPVAPQQQANTPAAVHHSSPVWPAVGWALLALLLIGAASLTLPMLARTRRRRMLRAQQHTPARVEAEWTVLRWRLEDLGVPARDGQSPRADEDYYRRVLGLAGDEARGGALHQVVRAVEAARYAPPSAGPEAGIHEASRQFVHETRSGVSARTRIVATLWPVTGRRAILAALRRLRPSPRGRRSQSR